MTLAAYRTLDCAGSGISNEVFLAAALMAFKEGADILSWVPPGLERHLDDADGFLSCSMSFGGPDDPDDDLLQKVLSELVDRGVVVVIAAGNDGGAGVSPLLAQPPSRY